MKKTRHYHSSNLSFIDMLFNIALSVTMLFYLSFMLINPPTQKKDIEAKAEIIIVMTWPDTSAHDVDLWMLTPDLARIGFPSKETEYANLERDDLGISNDVVTQEDGTTKAIRINREVITLRAKPDGRYVVNVHLFRRHVDRTLQDAALDEEPIPVKIEMIQINPTYKTIIIREVVLEQEKDEKTAFSFTINKGDVVETQTEVDESIVMSGQRALEPGRP